MLKLHIPKNRIQALARYVRDHYELDTLERSWEHYHKGRIEDVELRHGLSVHALVRTEKAQEVILDLESPVRSECSCSVDAHCEHKAALLFALYTPHGRPELLLQQLSQAIRVRARQQQSKKQTSSRTLQKRQERLDAPEPEHTPSVWHKFFDQQFYGFSLNQQQSIEQFYSTANEKLRPYGGEWELPLRQLYELHVVLFVMRKIEQFYGDSKSSYMSYYIETGCRSIAKQCHEELQQLIPELDMKSLTLHYAAAWKETLAIVQEAALSGKDSPLSWMTVYRTIWSRMSGEPKWLKPERTKVQKLLSGSGLTNRRRDALLLADGHFAMLEEGDAAARLRFDEMSRKEPREFFLYLHSCVQEAQWGRLLAWFHWLLPIMQKAQSEDMRQFCHYWAESVYQQASDAEWVGIMVALLPRTYQFYTTYLMRAKRYRAWIDLQLANRVSPFDLYGPDLATVEEHDLSLVLPLYHQAVERCIAEKNRTAYKNAIMLLKKLDRMYAKLGRTTVWDDYIYRLAGKHSRLRALQEELRKGKWIP
ncbi:hypothetical protein [Paenibacillus sp. YYML68]|uniref:hypothetical protein n=1 Tax=Paenibacillus sp. YYML68 TaxID=2909250 RepID=UPI002493013E|nr:hypothetical protein [Paenibacillus sp. YYML68]